LFRIGSQNGFFWYVMGFRRFVLARSIFRAVERLEADEGNPAPQTFPKRIHGQKNVVSRHGGGSSQPSVTNLWKERRAGISAGGVA